MKKTFVLSTAIAFFALGSSTLSAFAQQVVPAIDQGSYQTVALPQSTAIVTTFSDGIQFRVRRNENQPVTLVLKQPILDGSGNVIAPANSPVQAQIVPVDHNRGVQIRAESIVVNGQVIPIQAISSTVPTQRMRDPNANARNEQSIETSSRLSAALAGAHAQPNTDQIDTAVQQGGYSGVARAMLGNAIGELFDSNNIRVASFAPHSDWVLTLQAPVTVSVVMGSSSISPMYSSSSHAQITNQQAATQQFQPSTSPNSAINSGILSSQHFPSTQSEFAFRSSRQYTAMVEQILADYQQGKISGDAAQTEIAAADRFATTQLTLQLYPFAGVRQQVTQSLGFIYAIDR